MHAAEEDACSGGGFFPSPLHQSLEEILGRQNTGTGTQKQETGTQEQARDNGKTERQETGDDHSTGTCRRHRTRTTETMGRQNTGTTTTAP